MQQLTLRERFENWNDHLSVDLENRLVLNVALAGQSSRNGYRYTDEALTSAAALYENKPVFLDHAVQRQRPHERSTRDLVGSITNPRYVSGRVRGDIRVLDTESGQTFLKLVESQTPGVGMSHVVLAERSIDGKSVQRISDVISVDVVVNPATTSTFSESLITDVVDESATTSASQEVDHEILSEELTRLREERADLLAEVQQLKSDLAAATDRESVRQMLASSGLPPEAVSECFQRQLLNSPTPAVRQQLLQDRLFLVAGRRRESLPAASQERLSTHRPASVEDEFVRVLRRRS